MRGIAAIVPYDRNPRTHSPEQIALLASLMTKYGIDQPIVVDEDGVILKGHGRRLAAMEAGFKAFPVVVHHGLSEDDKRAIRIADNQVALLSGWDTDLLRTELTELSVAGYDMPMLGFNDTQLVSFMASVPTGVDPEATPEPPANPISRLGDMWVLGKHRILCGDSTRAKDVERLLGNKRVNLMVTDPPYGVEYDPAWRKVAGRGAGRALGKVLNDDIANWKAAWNLFPGNVAYVWHGALQTTEHARGLEAAGFEMRCQIIWDKGSIVISRGDYHWQHEPCWYAVRKGKPGRWAGTRSEGSVWNIAKNQVNETGHSTQKPVECMRRPIQNNSQPGEYVYDPFVGSGTTIVAAEMMTRYCLAMELSPVYVDVAVRRWQAFAKAKAVLEETGKTFTQTEDARGMASPRGRGGRTRVLKAPPVGDTGLSAKASQRSRKAAQWHPTRTHPEAGP